MYSSRDLLSGASPLPSALVLYERSAFVKVILIRQPVSKMFLRPKNLDLRIFRLELGIFIQVPDRVQLFHLVVSLAVGNPLAIYANAGSNRSFPREFRPLTFRLTYLSRDHKKVLSLTLHYFSRIRSWFQ